MELETGCNFGTPSYRVDHPYKQLISTLLGRCLLSISTYKINFQCKILLDHHGLCAIYKNILKFMWTFSIKHVVQGSDKEWSLGCVKLRSRYLRSKLGSGFQQASQRHERLREIGDGVAFRVDG